MSFTIAFIKILFRAVEVTVFINFALTQFAINRALTQDINAINLD